MGKDNFDVFVFWCVYVLAVVMAGHTADYVNSVLVKVASGDSSGGLTVYD